jgi:hypothetical protein
MERRVEPELLDDLPAADPRAVDSRRDLERLNHWMRHPQMMASQLLENLEASPVRCIAELGAGDGRFMLQVARRLSNRWPGVLVHLVDRKGTLDRRTRLAFDALGWKAQGLTTDVFAALDRPVLNRCEAIVANLFLHHFSFEGLRALFHGISKRTRLFVALEPSRSSLALVLSRYVGLIGCRKVTQHDAPVSVRAGFAGKELSPLWPDPEQWCCHEQAAGWCSHLFLARRRPTSGDRNDAGPP